MQASEREFAVMHVSRGREFMTASFRTMRRARDCCDALNASVEGESDDRMRDGLPVYYIKPVPLGWFK